MVVEGVEFLVAGCEPVVELGKEHSRLSETFGGRDEILYRR